MTKKVLCKQTEIRAQLKDLIKIKLGTTTSVQCHVHTALTGPGHLQLLNCPDYTLVYLSPKASERGLKNLNAKLKSALETQKALQI